MKKGADFVEDNPRYVRLFSGKSLQNSKPNEECTVSYSYKLICGFDISSFLGIPNIRFFTQLHFASRRVFKKQFSIIFEH